MFECICLHHAEANGAIEHRRLTGDVQKEPVGREQDISALKGLQRLSSNLGTGTMATDMGSLTVH